MEHPRTARSHAIAPSDTPSRKRQKVPVACAPCRGNKVECDAVFPVCTGCQQSTERAEYRYGTRRHDGKATSVGVNSRDPACRKEFESENTSNRLQGLFSQEFYTAGGGEKALPHGIIPLREEVPSPNISLDQGSQPTESISVDPMNGMTGDATQTLEVFGSSSAGSFMRDIQAAIIVKQSSLYRPAAGNSANITKHSMKDPPFYSNQEAALTVLPSRELADCLIRAYWEREWSIYPILSRRNIESVYQSLWISQKPDCSLISMSIINMCFALGCHYCELLSPQERKSLSQDFFARAESQFKKSQYLPTLERVQCLLLFGVYLQSTNYALLCWMTVGEAIRLAQSLGIYLDRRDLSESIECRENKRRTWHGCIWLDRVLSATLGRPGIIPKWLFNSTPFPSMIDDDFFDTQTEGSDMRPDGQPCILAFTVKAFELYQILDEILLKIYSTSTEDKKFDHKLTTLLEIDRKLQAWKRSLPAYLQYHQAGRSDGSIVNRQATILRIRFLHICILLFRPALIDYCKRCAPPSVEKPHDSSLSEAILDECVRLCFQLAHELVDIFTSKLDPQTPTTSPLPSWWYSVLYIFTAATIILVERFLEETRNTSKQKSNTCRTWDASIRILQSYSVVADSAGKCMTALEVLSENLCLDNNGKAEARHHESFLEMCRVLGERTSILPFDLDDFLWLG